MHKTLETSLIVLFLAALTGCAGRDFVRPGPDAFTLGQTTYSQTVQLLGEPKSVGSVTKNGKNVKSITYVYATTTGEPLEAGVIPARALTYDFYNEILVGQVFTSSFKSDNSNFDDAKIGAISKGKTTRAEVIQLLGKPSCSYIPPMSKETSGEAFGYLYVKTTNTAFGGLKNFIKSLTITFDGGDFVADVDYSSSGDQ